MRLCRSHSLSCKNGWGTALLARPSNIRNFAPTRLAQSKAKAEYLERNLRPIDVLIDQDAIKSGASASGQPWRYYYDLGLGLCTYDFFEYLPHRIACAKCSFYVLKGSSREQIMGGKANLLRMKQELSLTEEEVSAVDDGLAAFVTLQQKLANIPTPARPTLRQLEESLKPTDCHLSEKGPEKAVEEVSVRRKVAYST